LARIELTLDLIALDGRALGVALGGEAQPGARLHRIGGAIAAVAQHAPGFEHRGGMKLARGFAQQLEPARGIRIAHRETQAVARIRVAALGPKGPPALAFGAVLRDVLAEPVGIDELAAHDAGPVARPLGERAQARDGTVEDRPPERRRVATRRYERHLPRQEIARGKQGGQMVKSRIDAAAIERAQGGPVDLGEVVEALIRVTHHRMQVVGVRRKSETVEHLVAHAAREVPHAGPDIEFNPRDRPGPVPPKPGQTACAGDAGRRAVLGKKLDAKTLVGALAFEKRYRAPRDFGHGAQLTKRIFAFAARRVSGHADAHALVPAPDQARRNDIARGEAGRIVPEGQLLERVERAREPDCRFRQAGQDKRRSARASFRRARRQQRQRDQDTENFPHVQPPLRKEVTSIRRAPQARPAVTSARAANRSSRW
jgi:hypothetical protein